LVTGAVWEPRGGGEGKWKGTAGMHYSLGGCQEVVPLELEREKCLLCKHLKKYFLFKRTLY
jgi:hypothetical protein